jgi:CheY-like chemotaxis protein
LPESAVVLKTVLLVEDNADDVFFLKTACNSAGIPHYLSVVSDGDAAIDYLTGVSEYGDRRRHPVPDLIFLDIKLPRCNGHEVLAWIRGQAAFRNLPVIMLTGSDEPADIERAYALGVTSYLMKNADPDEFGAGVRVILKYWLQLNTSLRKR